MSRTLRVLVVDDSVVARRIVSEIVDDEEDLEVVGSAANGRIALAKLPRLKPDVVTLDIDMPELDGLETLSRIRAEFPSVKVVMLSNLTEKGASATVESLFRGASDYVTKASRMASAAQARAYLREQLVPKLRALAGVPRSVPAVSRPRPAPPRVAMPAASRAPIEIVAIGASTGGPNALQAVLQAVPGDFPVPIVIVQHMPENFTHYLAGRLDGKCSIRVHEAAAGDQLAPGHAWLAPGNRHMELKRTGDGLEIATTSEAPVNSCRPSVDVLFRTVAACFGGATLAVVLTGMGQDGLRGAELIRAAGGRILVQDQATSVVWGMPGQVASAGLAEAVLPIGEIGLEIVRRVLESRA